MFRFQNPITISKVLVLAFTSRKCLLGLLKMSTRSIELTARPLATSSRSHPPQLSGKQVRCPVDFFPPSLRSLFRRCSVEFQDCQY